MLREYQTITFGIMKVCLFNYIECLVFLSVALSLSHSLFFFYLARPLFLYLYFFFSLFFFPFFVIFIILLLLSFKPSKMERWQIITEFGEKVRYVEIIIPVRYWPL
jgi:hypothetical protein